MNLTTTLKIGIICSSEVLEIPLSFLISLTRLDVSIKSYKLSRYLWRIACTHQGSLQCWIIALLLLPCHFIPLKVITLDSPDSIIVFNFLFMIDVILTLNSRSTALILRFLLVGTNLEQQIQTKNLSFKKPDNDSVQTLGYLFWSLTLLHCLVHY